MKLKITEEEKKNILGLYGLINEQVNGGSTITSATTVSTTVSPIDAVKGKKYRFYSDENQSTNFGTFTISDIQEDEFTGDVKVYVDGLVYPRQIAGMAIDKGQQMSGYFTFSCESANSQNTRDKYFMLEVSGKTSGEVSEQSDSEEIPDAPISDTPQTSDPGTTSSDSTVTQTTTKKKRQPETKRFKIYHLELFKILARSFCVQDNWKWKPKSLG